MLRCARAPFPLQHPLLGVCPRGAASTTAITTSVRQYTRDSSTRSSSSSNTSADQPSLSTDDPDLSTLLKSRRHLPSPSSPSFWRGIRISLYNQDVPDTATSSTSTDPSSSAAPPGPRSLLDRITSASSLRSFQRRARTERARIRRLEQRADRLADDLDIPASERPVGYVALAARVREVLTSPTHQESLRALRVSVPPLKPRGGGEDGGAGGAGGGQHTAGERYVRALNRALLHAYAGRSPATRAALWKAYARARLRVPGLLSGVPPAAWDLIWYSQAAGAEGGVGAGAGAEGAEVEGDVGGKFRTGGRRSTGNENPGRDRHLRELAADLRRAGYAEGPPTRVKGWDRRVEDAFGRRKK